MKALLTIGHQTFLFPSEVEASRALTLMAKAICVRDHTYRSQPELELEEDFPPEISMKMITKPFKLVGKNGSPVAAAATKKKEGRRAVPKALPPPRLLMLE